MFTGNVNPPVSAEAVIVPVAPTFTVATANAPVPGLPANIHNAIIAGRSSQRDDIRNRRQGRRQQHRVQPLARLGGCCVGAAEVKGKFRGSKLSRGHD